jgi:hypothetical protein
MSLLPGQIQPETVPIGRLGKDGQSVMVDHNWWLLFYNICLNAFQPSGTPLPDVIELAAFFPKPTFPAPINPAGELLKALSLAPRHVPFDLGNSQDILMNKVFSHG